MQGVVVMGHQAAAAGVQAGVAVDGVTLLAAAPLAAAMCWQMLLQQERWQMQQWKKSYCWTWEVSPGMPKLGRCFDP